MTADNRNLIAVLVLLGLLAAACWLIYQHNHAGLKPIAGQWNLGTRTKTDGCQVNGPYQDMACTPGAVFPEATVAQICVRGYASSVRDVPLELKHEVYREYGIHHRRPGEYEVDHLVSLELGGSNDIANLWPEAAFPRPGFHQKDAVENYLHEEVCSGRVPLKQAQYEIATDWLKIYNAIK